jgi:polygalacturonase
MPHKSPLLLVISLLFAPADLHAGVFDVRDFGALGDQTTLDTAAIQAAVDACTRAGGGTVRVSRGDYLCGTVRLGSGVRLELASDATLWASRRAEDYLRGNASLLVAEKAQGIELVGPGTLRGIGEGDLGRRADKSDAKMPEFRAGILRFTNCRDVTVRNLQILYSDTWTLHFRFCDNITVEDVTIRNHYFHTNADGIDPVSCKKVRIARCDITAGDDCIVCKTADGRPCEDVRVSDCKLESIATAIKLGTESSGDFRDMQFTNCTIRNSTVGIGLFLKDGGTMEQIKFSKIRIENYTPRGESNVEKSMFPVFVDIERRNLDSQVGHIRDVTLEEIAIQSGYGALIQGMSESPIENLTLNKIDFQVREPQDYAQRRKHIGGRRSLSNQRDTEFARLPGWFVVAHTKGLTVDGLRVAMSDEDFRKYPRSALIAAGVDSPHIRNVTRQPQSPADAAPAVSLRPILPTPKTP